MSINAAAAAAAAVSEIVDLRFIFLQFGLQACSQLQVCLQLCLIQRERFRSYSHTSGLANAAEAIARATLCCYLGSVLLKSHCVGDGPASLLLLSENEKKTTSKSKRCWWSIRQKPFSSLPLPLVQLTVLLLETYF